MTNIHFKSQYIQLFTTINIFMIIIIIIIFKR